MWIHRWIDSLFSLCVGIDIDHQIYMNWSVPGFDSSFSVLDGCWRSDGDDGDDGLPFFQLALVNTTRTVHTDV